MAARNLTADREVQQVLDVLAREFGKQHPRSRIDAYRRDPGIVWIRVVDPCFANKDITERDAQLWEVLQCQLPKHLFTQIGLLMLLAPNELETSAMNYQFENPHDYSVDCAI